MPHFAQFRCITWLFQRLVVFGPAVCRTHIKQWFTTFAEGRGGAVAGGNVIVVRDSPAKNGLGVAQSPFSWAANRALDIGAELSLAPCSI
jgi:hypothetical protein